MKITFGGTRGSIAVSGPEYYRFGGNTTSLKVESRCIPQGMSMFVDAGSGIRPLCKNTSNEQMGEVAVLFTHYHPDHTMGLQFTRFVYDLDKKVSVLGPVKDGFGPEEMIRLCFDDRHFPVPAEKVVGHLSCTGIDPLKVIICHPQAGLHIISFEQFEKSERSATKQICLGEGAYEIEECLVIRSFLTVHQQKTLSYRFEERPTGKVFVFLTDHESTIGLSADLETHVQGASLLVQDCQYTDQEAIKFAGWGHGSPSYVALVAGNCKVGRLAITHHEPDRTDDQVIEMERLVKEAMVRRHAADVQVITCYDGLSLEV